jgi:hypothetical protein
MSQFGGGEVRHLAALSLSVLILAASLAAQSAVSKPAATPAPAKAATGTWKVPRTADGHPDLQGVWSNNSVTPMTRPTQWKDKDHLTDAEVKELQSLVAQSVDQQGDAVFQSLVQIALNLKDSGNYKQVSYDPTTGNYNQFWMADRDWDNRTSLITNPSNGQMPPLTAAAQERRARGRGAIVVEGSETGPRGRADGPEDRPLSERCISYGAPRVSTGYNSYMQIVQSPETVILYQEMIHDARVIPMDGRPHLPSTVRQLHGDSRGHWEGDTLVVETTNFINGFQGSTPNVKVTEKLTRPSADYVNWELTVNDPDTWTQPWTFVVRLKHTGDQIYEYACHEANYSMVGILGGARAEEAKAAAAKK